MVQEQEYELKQKIEVKQQDGLKEEKLTIPLKWTNKHYLNTGSRQASFT